MRFSGSPSAGHALFELWNCGCWPENRWHLSKQVEPCLDHFLLTWGPLASTGFLDFWRCRNPYTAETTINTISYPKNTTNIWNLNQIVFLASTSYWLSVRLENWRCWVLGSWPPWTHSSHHNSNGNWPKPSGWRCSLVLAILHIFRYFKWKVWYLGTWGDYLRFSWADTTDMRGSHLHLTSTWKW